MSRQKRHAGIKGTNALTVSAASQGSVTDDTTVGQFENIGTASSRRQTALTSAQFGQ